MIRRINRRRHFAEEATPEVAAQTTAVATADLIPYLDVQSDDKEAIEAISDATGSSTEYVGELVEITNEAKEECTNCSESEKEEVIDNFSKKIKRAVRNAKMSRSFARSSRNFAEEQKDVTGEDKVLAIAEVASMLSNQAIEEVKPAEITEVISKATQTPTEIVEPVVKAVAFAVSRRKSRVARRSFSKKIARRRSFGRRRFSEDEFSGRKFGARRLSRREMCGRNMSDSDIPSDEEVIDVTESASVTEPSMETPVQASRHSRRMARRMSRRPSRFAADDIEINGKIETPKTVEPKLLTPEESQESLRKDVDPDILQEGAPELPDTVNDNESAETDMIASQEMATVNASRRARMFRRGARNFSSSGDVKSPLFRFMKERELA